MKKSHVLIVEDEGLVALELKEALTKMGYGVTNVVSSGQEALETVVTDCPDLILMDIRLDGPLDGIETARRVKEICSIPVIYLTADINDATLLRATTTDSYGYIIKPFEERALHASIEIALSKALRDGVKKEEQEWNEVILKNIDDIIIGTDSKGFVTHVNQNAVEALGRREHECLGKKLDEIVRVTDNATGAPEIFSMTKVIVDNENVEKPDCRLTTAAEGSLPVACRFSPLKNINNNTIGAILFIKRLT